MTDTYDSISRFRAATEANDIDAVIDTLAPEVELVSPISGHLVFRGKEDLRVLLTAVYGAIQHLHWHDEIIGRHDVCVLAGEATVSCVHLTDATVLHLTQDGQICRIRPHLRPWIALTLLAVRLMPSIARNPGLAWRAFRAS